MTEKDQSNDTKKEEKPATPQPTELKTKWVTDSANKEIKGTILNEDKKK
jgi:hypothetical protein